MVFKARCRVIDSLIARIVHNDQAGFQKIMDLKIKLVLNKSINYQEGNRAGRPPPYLVRSL